MLREAGLADPLADVLRDWHFFDDGRLEENLFTVRHDALAVVGAFGHGVISDMVFGSKMEIIQATLSNNLLIVGPKYTARG